MLHKLHWSLHQEMLQEEIAGKRLGIISDFDGTLSHFVDQAADAVATPHNIRAIDALLPKVALFALISGRSSADLRTRLTHPDIIYYGNHGMDFWRNGRVHTARKALIWQQPLQSLLAALNIPADSGVYVENKGITASIHYRAASKAELIGAALEEQLRPLCDQYGFALTPGNMVWEIKPPITINKGAALRAIVIYHDLDSVVYLGDDATDLSAMDELNRLSSAYKPTASNDLFRAVSVGVHHPNAPPDLTDHCDVLADGPDDVAQLLYWIADHLPAATHTTPGSQHGTGSSKPDVAR
ncbi:MAG: trehalose-phosphatase [Anaerolineae bacterium]|nr:trehalose-phosphatase [Anaerolineae bacterium]